MPCREEQGTGALGLTPSPFTLSLLSLADLGPEEHTASSHHAPHPPISGILLPQQPHLGETKGT